MAARLLALVVAIAFVPSIGVVPATANHSVPVPLWFWDPDFNAVPGPEPKVDADGAYWSTSHLNRLNEVVAEWSGDTDFDIGTVSSGTQKAYVDGRLPPCSTFGFDPPGPGIALAVTCVPHELAYYPYGGGTFYRISDLDVYFNMENPDSPNWWVGATYPPDPDRLHFAGVLTNELGHFVFLNDIPDSDCTHTAAGFFTMCGAVLDGDLDTWRMTSLHSDDISSANAVYP